MKKQALVLIMTLIASISMSETSLAPPYSVVCIDPGHGGRGADKFHNGGDGSGTSGPVLGIAEQWVNWQVACKVRDLLLNQMAFPVVMTREVEADTNLPLTQTANLWYRANKANYANVGGPVTQFISIHHNGYTPIPGSQGTEVWWSSQLYTDSSYLRNRGYWRPAYQDSLLAMKSHLRLLDAWGYKDRCVTRCWPGSGSSFCCDDDYFVLRNTVMPSALSEASNLKDTTEELLFDDPYSGHADSEAMALYDGWYSHADNAGIAIVRNSYALGGGGEVIITDDWPCTGGDTISSPYITCWLVGETHCLKAITPQNISGHECVFHHWSHFDPYGSMITEDWYDPEWPISVTAEFDYHRYVAYFTGGPYSAQVVSPDGNQIWHVGEERTIEWDVSPGADSSTRVDVFLDRNGGNDGYPEQILDSIPGAYYWGWAWTVTPPYSTHCRMKVVAYDRAGNSAEDVSNQDFIISDSGNNNPDLYSHIQCKYPQDECADCMKYGESVTIEILANDPDGDSIFYEWYAWFGHFAENGQHTVTTAQNSVTYVAPTKAKEGETVQFQDYISVGVTDVRGGQTFAVGEPELHDEGYTCNCGDANDDGVVNVGDVVYLVSYLYKGGAEPVAPTERGDANNDCIINVGDVVYLKTYLYQGGPQPECCWFVPGEKLELKGYSFR